MAFAQPATFNEPWTDARVLAYLERQPPSGVNADYHVLYTAYKHMRPEDFARLLTAFKAQGRNVHALSPQGQSLKDEIAAHPRHAAAFIKLLEQA